jgi:hypothetical protein
VFGAPIGAGNRLLPLGALTNLDFWTDYVNMDNIRLISFKGIGEPHGKTQDDAPG